MFDDVRIAELRALRGDGLVSAVGEYTPDEFWEALDEIERLHEALRRAAAWGISSAAFDAPTACELEDWVKGGMRGELPPLAPYLTPKGQCFPSDEEVTARHEGFDCGEVFHGARLTPKTDRKLMAMGQAIQDAKAGKR